jgi:hypothetical protein
MLKTWAIIFGLVFLFLGILGFIPHAAPHQMLLGIFNINMAHNLVHIVTGAIALWVGCKDSYASKLFFQIFGVLYLIVAIVGFINVEKPIFGFMANNMANSWLHLVIALIALYLGFIFRQKKAKRR